jgi:hypothetical protein
MNDGFASRKLWLSVAFMVASFGFGVWCAHKGVDLSNAAVFVGAVSASQIAYLTANIWERKIANGSYGKPTTDASART